MNQYTPMSRQQFDAVCGNMDSGQLRRFVRSERQGESDALNGAKVEEMETALTSGRPIAETIYNMRLEEAARKGPKWKGYTTFVKAGKASGKSEGDIEFEVRAMQGQQPAEPKASVPMAAKPRAGEPKAAGILEAAEAKAASNSIEDAIRKIAETAASPIDESMVRKIAEEAASAKAEEVATRPITVTIRDRVEPMVIDSPHESLAEALRIAMTHGRLLMHGPKGTGKSRIAKDIAKALEYGDNYRLFSCTAETSVYDLFGARDANGVFHPGVVLDAYENGYVLLLDEADALDPSTGVACNAALDNGGNCSVPQRSNAPMAMRHDMFLPILAMNTLHGSTAAYTGRMKQDAATMSRFPELTRLHVDYCRKLEARILADAPDLAKKMWSLRDEARKMNLDESRVITTRDFESAACEVAARKRGDDGCLSDARIMERMVAGWTPEERRKVGC